MNITLWVVQGVLAALFLFGGVFKLIMPVAELEAQANMSGAFLKFIGVMEALGGLGLLLPGLLGIKPGLTPLAAAGLVVIMIGATVVTLMTGAIVPALMPLLVGVLAAFVAYGRWRVAPHPARGAHPSTYESDALRSRR